MTSPNDDARAASSGTRPASGAIPGISNLPTPARLTVGLVSAGRVGTALGEALERAGHVVGAVVARSPQSRRRVAQRLPESAVLDLADVVARSELLIISVPDAVLPSVIDDVAATGALRPGTLVAHTAGAHGIGILSPLVELGAIGLAIHPAMTFVGTVDDTARLAQACFGITAAGEVGDAIASALVLEMGGEPVRVAEADRTLYHAALAHGGNHLVALVDDAISALNRAIAGSGGAGQSTATVDGNPVRLAERILAPLLTASLQNVLDLGAGALTGPVARGDADAVAAHLAALRTLPDADTDDSIAEAYRILARRAAHQSGAPPAVLDVLEPR
ncbi:Rossmann-like and DUF2520 domain-containing protein [Gordonia sp. DT30]|uniref:Rossmann-like and DUF2520 domain-containing protein n=1 Tax=Gordonia sp. DT30 TaxID=3416546 RepID=UPI003CEB4A0E